MDQQKAMPFAGRQSRGAHGQLENRMSNLREGIALNVLAAAICIPLLVSRHTLPLSTFYGEWTSALTFLLATMAVALLAPNTGCASIGPRDAGPPGGASGQGLPRIAALPLWLIATGLLMTATGAPDLTGSRAMTMASLMLAAVAMWAGYRLRLRWRADRVLTAISVGWLIAGLLGSVAQWVQVFGLEGSSLNLVSEYFYETHRRLWGNLNQPNHQATVNGLALAASVWLASQGVLRVAPWLMAVLVLESGIVLAGSRTGVLHVGLVALYALIAAWLAGPARGHANPMRRPTGLVFAAVALVAMLGMLQPAIRAAGHAFDWQLFDTMAQLQAGDQISGRRALWLHAWQMFLANPWLGVGWGEFGWAQFQQLDRLGVTVEMSLHAHNAVLDMLAKTGLVGTVGVVAILATWFWRVVRVRLLAGEAAGRIGTVTALTWLAMLCAHSMLEYPLHYLYFFLPFCLLLAWLDPAGLLPGRPTATAGMPPPLRGLLAGLVAAVSVAALATLWQDYRRVEAREYATRDRLDALPLPRFWFRAHASAHRAEMADLAPANAGFWLPRHLAAVHLLPTPAMIARSAWLLALTGREDQARLWMERLHYYYLGDEAAQFAMVARLCDAQAADERPADFCDWIGKQTARKPLFR